MAAPTPIGFNFTKINDYDLSFDFPSSPDDWIPYITNKANSVTNYRLGYILLGAISFLLYWILYDKSPISKFRYSSSRAFLISSGITSVIGFSFLEAGFITSFWVVAFITVLYIGWFIFISSYEMRQ